MTDFRITGNRGTTIKFDETITRPVGVPPVDTPIDLTLAGTKLTLTGKLKKSDLVPLFIKDYWQAGGAPHGGITVAAGGVAHITILPADTAALAETTYVLCDIVLIESSGDVSTVASGVIKVKAGVGT